MRPIRSALIVFFILVVLSPEAGAGEISYIDSNPAAGFHWPYYLYVPSTVTGNEFLVFSNNTGYATDDFSIHKDMALSFVTWRKTWADALEIPLLVPVFPRFKNGYTEAIAAPQYLLRASFETDMAEYSRIDLQFLAMIDDAVKRLGTKGLMVNGKLFVWGYSASGAFASRFISLHPDKISAAAFGGHGWPPAPAAAWQGQNLPYPYGVYDYQGLTGTAFDLNAYNKIPLYFYMGEQDTNGWALPWLDIGEGADPMTLYTWLTGNFGTSASSLMAGFKQIYESMGGANAEFHIYPDAEHQMTEQMDADVLNFFMNIITAANAYTYYADADGDGYGDPLTSVQGTFLPSGYDYNDTDCDDGDPNIYPGAKETDGDGVDQNCDGVEIQSASLLPIAVDGNSSDWGAYSPVLTDSADDATGSAPSSDITQVYFEVDPFFAYFALKTAGGPLQNSEVLELAFDVVEKGGNIREMSLNAASDGTFAMFESVGGQVGSVGNSGAVTASGEVFELKIPLNNFNDPVEMRAVYAGIWDTVPDPSVKVDFVQGNDGPWKLIFPANPVLSVKVNAQTVTLWWDPVFNATGYRIFYALAPYSGVDSVQEIDMGNQTGLSVDLWSGASFLVAVRSYNDNGAGAFSNIEQFTLP